MKILFICTSLEPGRDGVGDYTRLLASACIEAGHEVHLLALNDQHLGPTELNEPQSIRQHVIPALRLSSRSDWVNRFASARIFTENFSPDCVSWQLVPYGFHPKGIFPALADSFNALSAGRRCHVMLHELWIGLSRGESLKNRAYGFLQRRALLRFLRALSPAHIDTTNPSYQLALRHENIASELLPLFGNIPVASAVPHTPDSFLRGAIFGTVHPQFSPEPFFSQLLSVAQSLGRQLHITGLGRLGAHGEAMFAQLKKHYTDTATFEAAGEFPPAEISLRLQALDFGIGTHPWALIGKSGAVAAMLDHGLPVVVPRDDWALRRDATPLPGIDPLLIKATELTRGRAPTWLALRRPPTARLASITDTFLQRIHSSTALS